MHLVTLISTISLFLLLLEFVTYFWFTTSPSSKELESSAFVKSGIE